MAAEFWCENAKDKLERMRHAAVVSGHFVEKGPTEEFEENATKERRDQTMFHWPLEFPEVIVKRGGFDAFVGNPPFMGGQKITGNLGTLYRDYLVEHLAGRKRGSADLCAYFLLCASQLMKMSGQSGFLATNTIAQGDTREVGFDQLAAKGCTFHRAMPSRPWPGTANLEVAHLWFSRGAWVGLFILDDEPTFGITPFLSPPSTVTGNPNRLKANESRSFQGSIVLGMGFVLAPVEAQRLIEKDLRNKDVVFPYLNGEDLNSRPDQSASRWVINFFDWPLTKATEYEDCLRIVEKNVKPERERNNRKARREAWWLFAERASGLYTSLNESRTLMVRGRISPTHAYSFVSKGQVIEASVVAFPNADIVLFGVLQSSIHYCWAMEYTPTFGKSTFVYAPSQCFETFPLPVQLGAIGVVAEVYYEYRKKVMLSHHNGLTAVYNRIHNPDEGSTDIQKLRELHIEMDQAVAAAYGWTDLALGHGFHETKQGVRFTISESARREVLQRLLKLNHERYAEEVKQGLHSKKSAAKNSASKKKAASKPAKEESTLFDMEERSDDA